MAKSFKIEDEIYLDSGSVAKGNENLNDYLENKNIFKNLINIGNARKTTNADITIDSSNNQLLINGSSTTSTNLLLNAPNNNKDKDGIILKPGTYTASIKKISGSLADNLITFYLRKNNGSHLYDGYSLFTQDIPAGISDGTIYSATFTLTEETRLHWIGYFDDVLRTFNDLVLVFQIEENIETTRYAPYAGYIVGSGSNDNGNWIKLSDGTLIQYGKIAKSINIKTKSGTSGWYYDDGLVVNFPLSFNDTDYFAEVITTINSLSSINIYSITNLQKSFCNFNLSSAVEYSNSNYEFRWFAIGRWK